MLGRRSPLRDFSLEALGFSKLSPKHLPSFKDDFFLLGNICDTDTLIRYHTRFRMYLPTLF